MSQGQSRCLKIPIPVAPKSEREIIAGWECMSATPVVSVCCATYNHVDYVADAICGFLSQKTNFRFEIILRDDASSDGTTDVVLDYAKRYPNIIRTIINTENQFQKGIRPIHIWPTIATGKYIALCEGDDYWVDCKKLQLQVDFLESNLDYSVCYTNAIAFDKNGILNHDFGGARRGLTSDELRKSPSIYTLTAVFRNCISLPPEFATLGYGDLALWCLLGEYGKGHYHKEIQPSMYRVHPGGIHSMSSAQTKAYMRIKTYIAQVSYFERKQDIALMQYYRLKLSKEILATDGLDPKLFSTLRFFSFIFRFLRNCKFKLIQFLKY